MRLPRSASARISTARLYRQNIAGRSGSPDRVVKSVIVESDPKQHDEMRMRRIARVLERLVVSMRMNLRRTVPALVVLHRRSASSSSAILGRSGRLRILKAGLIPVCKF